MKMLSKTNNKTLVMLICITAMLVSFTTFGTLAYLTDTSELVNTFTIGKVDIDLNESDVDNDNDTKKNEYKLMPGATYIKDPTITVKEGSEESYIRMMVTIHNKSAVDDIINNDKHKKPDGTDIKEYSDFIIFEEWDKKDPIEWQFEKQTADAEANTVTLEYRYYQKVDGYNDAGGKEEVDLPALFSKLVIPRTLGLDDLNALENGKFKIVVTGHAIQALGFENEDEAWDAFDEETQGAGDNAGN